ncbi:MAG: zinc-binding alcohol dehydrogenase [Candidatus Omnitrophota bacterium]
MKRKTEYGIMFTQKESARLSPITDVIREIGPKDISGKTIATLISPGTELAVYRGFSNNFPCASGYAAIFEVESIGQEVKNIKIGDKVFCAGPHRSFQVVNENDVLILPEKLSPANAVFARMMAISMTTLTTTNARPPAKVLITGLGLVGHLAARIFAHCGYRVFSCDPSALKRKTATGQGVRNIFETVPFNNPEVAGQIDLVIECSGNEQAVIDGCRIAKRGAEIVLVGVPWKKQTDILAHELLSLVFHNYIVLRSGWEWSLPIHPTPFQKNSIFENLAGALQWLAEEKINVNNLATVSSPDKAQEIYQDLLFGRNKKLSVVFDWSLVV